MTSMRISHSSQQKQEVLLVKLFGATLNEACIAMNSSTVTRTKEASDRLHVGADNFPQITFRNGR